MDVAYMVPNRDFDRYFLEALSESASKEMDIHQEQKAKNDWTYHQILDIDTTIELGKLDPLVLEASVLGIYLGNMAVEKGHAEYDRITAEVFEQNPTFRRWKNLWVAEEEPHGEAMMQWGKARRLFDPHTTEKRHQGYLKNGASLHFDDAAYGLAYPALQEIATALTHSEVMKRLPSTEKIGKKLLGQIVGDEKKHERFYATMVAHALQSGEKSVVSHQLRAITRAVLGFAMPGMEQDIPDENNDIKHAYHSSGAFTLGRVATEVFLPVLDGNGRYGWNIENIASSDLDDDGKQAQERLVKFTEDIKDASKATHPERKLVLVMGKGRKEITKLAAAA